MGSPSSRRTVMKWEGKTASLVRQRKTGRNICRQAAVDVSNRIVTKMTRYVDPKGPKSFYIIIVRAASLDRTLLCASCLSSEGVDLCAGQCQSLWDKSPEQSDGRQPGPTGFRTNPAHHFSAMRALGKPRGPPLYPPLDWSAYR